jgi:hypothetical protein
MSRAEVFIDRGKTREEEPGEEQTVAGEARFALGGVIGRYRL